MKKTLKILKLNDLSLIFLSSEDYEYLWSDFTSLWNKYCNSLKIRKYLITTAKKGRINDFKILSSKLDKFDFWSKRIQSSVEKISTKNLLVLTDDSFISEKLDLQSFFETYQFFKKKKIKYLQLSPTYNFSIKKKISFLDYYSFHRISLQPSLWKKEYFLKMLSYEENPREFEVNGSIRTKVKEKIYYANYFVIKYIEIIRKGKMTPEGYNLVRKEFKKIKKKYKKMNFIELFDHFYKKYKGLIFYVLPFNFKKNFVKKKIQLYKSTKSLQRPM